MCAAAMAQPILWPLQARNLDTKLRNWAGNLDFSTDRLYSAQSVDQVRDYVTKQEKLKVLGTRHCFNNIADSKHAFLSVMSMNDVIVLDPRAGTVIVGAGMTYGKLSPWLHSKGFALHNLASLPDISIAGACTTATHGSGVKNGNLSTAVSALEFVNANGDLIPLSRAQNGDAFQGAVVGLGALGVITKLTLDIEPTYMVRQFVYENMPLSELKNHFDEIESAAYSVSLFTDWQNRRISEVWLKVRDGDGKRFDAPAEFFGAKRATRNMHPIASLSAVNCTEQMGVPGPWYDRLPHFRIGFTPSAGKELQTEYFVARKNAVDAIQAVEQLHEQVSPHLLITEIRTIAADKLWLSPCYGQDSVTIHFTWKPEWPAVSALMPVIERQLAPFNPRPHWAKLFTVPPEELRAKYVKMREFLELAQKFDPPGKFRNEFLNKYIFDT